MVFHKARKVHTGTHQFAVAREATLLKTVERFAGFVVAREDPRSGLDVGINLKNGGTPIGRWQGGLR